MSVLHALRFTGTGVVNIGGGLVVDMLKRHWGAMLTLCMLSAGLFFALAGAAPGYIALALIAPLVAIPGALWHLPSAASLSQIFADRRGFAISIHGLGSNFGNLVGPLVATALLGLLGTWRGVMFVYVGPALVMGTIVMGLLEERRQYRIGGAPRTLDPDPRICSAGPQSRCADARGGGDVARHRSRRRLRLVAVLPQGLAGEGHPDAGFHFALLTGMGIVSAPLLGYLSDRSSRKAVLAPGFVLRQRCRS